MNAGGSVVIKEFLVSLGFAENAAGLRRFVGGVASATGTVTMLGAAVVAASAAVGAFMHRAASDLNELSDFSKRVGVAADEVARLGYVAKLTDSSVEDVKGALESLSNAAGQVAVGGGPKQTFDLLRISVRGANGQLKGAGQLLDEVGSRIRRLPRAQQLSMLGSLGINRNMLRMMTEDVSGLRAEFDQIYAAAGVGLNEAAQRGSDYMDTINRLKFTLEGFTRAISLRLMGQISDAMDRFRRFLLDNMKQILDTLEPVISSLLQFGEAFMILVGRVLEWVGKFIRGFRQLNEATDGFLGWVAMAAVAWRVLNLSFMATPIGAIITGILALGVAIAALIDDFMVWKEGGKSLIDWSEWEPVINFAIAGLELLGEAFVTSITMMLRLLKSFFQFLTGDFSGAWETFGKAMQPIIDAFALMWEYLSKIMSIGDLMASIGSFFGLGGTPGESAFPEGFWEPKRPGPAQQAALGGMSMQQTTQINVNGAGDPRAVGREVAGLQGRVNDEIFRNFQGAVR